MNKEDKKAFNEISAEIRLVKKQKAQAYREYRMEDAKDLQQYEVYLRQISNKIQGRNLELFLGKSIFSI
jgi:hypothetical protein